MRVRVKYAAFERGLPHKANDAARDHRSARLWQVGNLGSLPPFETLLHENTVLRVFVDYVGNFESELAFERLAKKHCVRRLAGIIEFSSQGIAELSDQASRIVFLQNRKARRPLIEEACQYFKIDLH